MIGDPCIICGDPSVNAGYCRACDQFRRASRSPAAGVEGIAEGCDGPSEIWLQPECCAGPDGRLWSMDWPEECCCAEPSEPTRYVRADLIPQSPPERSAPSAARDPEFFDQIVKAETLIAQGFIDARDVASVLFGVFDQGAVAKLLRYARMWSLAIPALDDGAGNGGAG